MGDFFGGAEKIDIQARLPRTVQHAGNQKDLPVIQRDAKLATVRADEDVVDHAVPKLPDRVRNTTKILNRG